MITVYVRLLCEGTEVFRPTGAVQMANEVYRLLPTVNYDPADELWEFPPGALVHCQIKKLSEGDVLVAVNVAVAD